MEDALFDFFVIIAEIHYLRRFRKRMMDLEMDFNVVVQGKIFFVNQTGLLSDSQTIESEKPYFVCCIYDDNFHFTSSERI